MSLKRLDMPENNGICSLYSEFCEQIDRGRAVAVIFCHDHKGNPSSYLYSAKINAQVDKKSAAQHILNVTARAHRVAESQGHHPGPYIMA